MVHFPLVRTYEFSYDGAPERQVCHSDDYLDHTGAVQFFVYTWSAEFEVEHNGYGEYGGNEHPLDERFAQRSDDESNHQNHFQGTGRNLWLHGNISIEKLKGGLVKGW